MNYVLPLIATNKQQKRKKILTLLTSIEDAKIQEKEKRTGKKFPD